MPRIERLLGAEELSESRAGRVVLHRVHETLGLLLELARLHRTEAFQLPDLLDHVLVPVEPETGDFRQDEAAEHKVIEEIVVLGDAPFARAEAGQHGRRDAPKPHPDAHVREMHTENTEHALNDFRDRLAHTVRAEASLQNVDLDVRLFTVGDDAEGVAREEPVRRARENREHALEHLENRAHERDELRAPIEARADVVEIHERHRRKRIGERQLLRGNGLSLAGLRLGADVSRERFHGQGNVHAGLRVRAERDRVGRGHERAEKLLRRELRALTR